MLIALASPAVAASLDDGLTRAERLIADAAARRAEIVCFPEAYLPGLRGVDIDVPPFTPDDESLAMTAVAELARAHRIAVIMGIEKLAEHGRQIAACVFDADGSVQGVQTKTQLAPSEDAFYVPGHGRQLFEVNGVKFGIAICHEGWRYPETVRWAATRGASIVFHPQHTGSQLTPGDANAYYEKAMLMRSIENAIYFASVNYALPFAESATSLIAPSGERQAHLPYGEEGVLIAEIDPAAATAVYAKRFAPERFEAR